MNPEQLWETTMNPERPQADAGHASRTRAEAERMVSVLMGDKVEPRTRLHQRSTPNFNREDNFEGRVENG